MSVLLQLDKFLTRIILVLRVRLPYSIYAATYHPLLQGGVEFNQDEQSFASLFKEKEVQLYRPIVTFEVFNANISIKLETNTQDMFFLFASHARKSLHSRNLN